MHWKTLGISVLLVATLGFIRVFLHYVPFEAPSYAAWSGIFAVLIGFVSLLKPLRFVGVRSRRRALAVLLLGFFLAFVAVFWPAPAVRVGGGGERLDEFLPAYHFAEYHETEVSASRQRLYEAMHEVSIVDMPAAFFLLRLRALAGGRFGAQPVNETPILEVIVHPDSGFLALDVSDPAEIVYGMAGRPWTAKKPPPVEAPEDFLAFRQPGQVKVAFNFRLREVGDGRFLLSTETRIVGNDATAQRLFARYWRLIYPGSAIIRRVWLDAIAARAERKS